MADDPNVGKLIYDQLARSEWSKEFESLMRNQLIMGALRYGPFYRDNGYDCIKGAQDKIKAYVSTGNTENLVDAANLLMKEFAVGKHPNKHFSATDDKNHTPKQ